MNKENWRKTQSGGNDSGFWKGFLAVLVKSGIQEKQRPYYARWVERAESEAGPVGPMDDGTVGGIYCEIGGRGAGRLADLPGD